MVTSSSEAVLDNMKRTKLIEVNEWITCYLCGGYLIEATTIIECIHSFCRSCIVKHLDSELQPKCPTCETHLHKTKPLSSLRSDKTLQEIVYKLVPSLYKREMSERRDFYVKNDALAANEPVTCDEQRGETGCSRLYYSPENKMSLSLEYGFGDNQIPTELSAVTAVKESGGELSSTLDPIRRYLRCVAGMPVAFLKQFIAKKYSLTGDYVVNIMYLENVLEDYITLMDVAYVYSWHSSEPMRLFYRISPKVKTETQFVREKLAERERFKRDQADAERDANRSTQANSSSAKRQCASSASTPSVSQLNANRSGNGVKSLKVTECSATITTSSATTTSPSVTKKGLKVADGVNLKRVECSPQPATKSPLVSVSTPRASNLNVVTCPTTSVTTHSSKVTSCEATSSKVVGCEVTSSKVTAAAASSSKVVSAKANTTSSMVVAKGQCSPSSSSSVSLKQSAVSQSNTTNSTTDSSRSGSEAIVGKGVSDVSPLPKVVSHTHSKSNRESSERLDQQRKQLDKEAKWKQLERELERVHDGRKIVAGSTSSTSTGTSTEKRRHHHKKSKKSSTDKEKRDREEQRLLTAMKARDKISKERREEAKRAGYSRPGATGHSAGESKDRMGKTSSVSGSAKGSQLHSPVPVRVSVDTIGVNFHSSVTSKGITIVRDVNRSSLANSSSADKGQVSPSSSSSLLSPALLSPVSSNSQFEAATAASTVSSASTACTAAATRTVCAKTLNIPSCSTLPSCSSSGSLSSVTVTASKATSTPTATGTAKTLKLAAASTTSALNTPKSVNALVVQANAPTAACTSTLSLCTSSTSTSSAATAKKIKLVQEVNRIAQARAGTAAASRRSPDPSYGHGVNALSSTCSSPPSRVGQSTGAADHSSPAACQLNIPLNLSLSSGVQAKGLMSMSGSHGDAGSRSQSLTIATHSLADSVRSEQLSCSAAASSSTCTVSAASSINCSAAAKATSTTTSTVSNGSETLKEAASALPCSSSLAASCLSSSSSCNSLTTNKKLKFVHDVNRILKLTPSSSSMSGARDKGLGQFGLHVPTAPVTGKGAGCSSLASHLALNIPKTSSFVNGGSNAMASSSWSSGCKKMKVGHDVNRIEQADSSSDRSCSSVSVGGSTNANTSLVGQTINATCQLNVPLNLSLSASSSSSSAASSAVSRGLAVNPLLRDVNRSSSLTVATNGHFSSKRAWWL